MKHCGLVGLVENLIGCAEAVGDRGERVLHQRIKVKVLVNVLRLDEQHESKVTLLTILYYLKKCEQLYRS